MARKFTDPQTLKDIHTAHHVERRKILDEERVVDVYKDGLSIAERLKKMLRPLWFLQHFGGHRRKK